MRHLLYKFDDFFKPVTVCFSEGAQLFAIDVQDGDYAAVTPYRYHDFALRFAAACDVSRELIHVRHDDRLATLPCATAYAFAVSYLSTSGRPLKRS